jgi:hypothetical protein
MKSGSDVGNGSVVAMVGYCRTPGFGKQPDKHGIFFRFQRRKA